MRLGFEPVGEPVDVPAVVVTAPAGGEVLAGGTPTTIEWTATGPNLTAEPINIDVSTDDGASWSAVAGPLANTGTYSWSLPLIDSARCRVRVSALDEAGNVDRGASAQTFTIDSLAPAFVAGAM